MEKYCSIVKSPVGDVIIIADEYAVNEITFHPKETDGLQENQISQLAAKQIAQYFEGTLKEFSFPMSQTGTEFQKKYGKIY